MNKLFLVFILTIIMVPQVVFAAWWNPFSWKVFTKMFTPKTETIQTTQTATTTNSSTEIEKLRAEVEGLKKQQASNASSQEKANNSTTVISPTIVKTPTITQSTVNYDALYKDINDKYFNFRDDIEKRIFFVEKSGPDNSSTKTDYLTFVKNLSKTVNADMKELNNFWNVTPKPANIVNTYIEKYAQLLNDYNSQKEIYDRYLNGLKEIEEAQVREEAAKIEYSNSKQGKLDAINLQIANLNTKYVNELKALQSSGQNDVQRGAEEKEINRRYNLDYLTLTAEYQTILYGE